MHTGRVKTIMEDEQQSVKSYLEKELVKIDRAGGEVEVAAAGAFSAAASEGRPPPSSFRRHGGHEDSVSWGLGVFVGSVKGEVFPVHGLSSVSCSVPGPKA
jgi:hypothetical protein